MPLFEELRRRNALRVALAYLAGAWLLLQVADVLIDNDLLPGWVFQSGLLILYQNAPVNFPKEPMLRNIHDDPRWNELLKKLGKSREQLAAIEFNPKLPE